MAFDLQKATVAITKAIKSIRTRSNTLRFDIQGCLSDAAEIAMNTGDCVYVTRTVNAMGNGMRRDSAVTWLSIHTPIVSKSAKEGTKDVYTINDKNYVFGLSKGWQANEFDLVAMRETVPGKPKQFVYPWDRATKESLPTAFDLKETVRKAVANWQNRAELLSDEKPFVAGQDELAKKLAKVIGE